MQKKIYQNQHKLLCTVTPKASVLDQKTVVGPSGAGRLGGHPPSCRRWSSRPPGTRRLTAAPWRPGMVRSPLIFLLGPAHIFNNKNMILGVGVVMNGAAASALAISGIRRHRDATPGGRDLKPVAQKKWASIDVELWHRFRQAEMDARQNGEGNGHWQCLELDVHM